MNCASYCLTTGRWHFFDTFCTAMRQAGPNEGVVVIPDDVRDEWAKRRESGDGTDFVQEYVSSLTGLPGTADRYVALDKDTGEILHQTLICCMDCHPKAAYFDAFDVKRHDAADTKWTYDKATDTFIPPPKPADFDQLKAASLAQLAAAAS